MRGLPDKTWGLFERLRVFPAMTDYILVGGTALALRLEHRLSEDLDFLAAGTIDKHQIDAMLAQLRDQGLKVSRRMDMEAALDRGPGDPDPELYSLRWTVDGVKLDFFTKRVYPDGKLLDAVTLVSTPVKDLDSGHIRVASEDSIFLLKAQLPEERIAARDFFDLRVLLRNQRGIPELLQAAETMGADRELIKQRILYGRRRADDPPVTSLLDIPADFESCRAWLTEMFNEHERELAKRAAGNK